MSDFNNLKSDDEEFEKTFLGSTLETKIEQTKETIKLCICKHEKHLHKEIGCLICYCTSFLTN